MDRLTYRSPKFNSPVSHGACKDITCSAECDSCKINDLISKLCAYEDTGLEPEDIVGLKNTCDQLHGINDSLFKANQEMGKDLKEWKKAHDDGRLVVLPCKVGDTVYEISNNTDACNGCQHYEGIYGSGESWCAQIDDVDLRSYPNITRAEAEAAMAQEGDSE